MSRFWKQYFGKKSARPWAEGRPIFLALQEWNGDLSFELPDEPETRQSEIRFAAGLLDGIFSHHAGATEEDRRNDMLDSIIFTLNRLAATNSDEARAALYNIFLGESALSYADALVERLASQHKLGRDDIRPHARWLVHHAAHREPLKLGILLLGLSGTEADIDDLKVLVRHDEFTLYAAVAAGNIVHDPVDIWWEMARNVHGWGKVHLVERLGERAMGRAELQAWLLMRREGVFSDALIAAGLRSPVIRNRNMAAAALESHPVTAWGERTRESLHKTVSDECSEELRERLRGVINKS